VANSTLFKYRAFLSYSHRDKAWCEWLYGALGQVRVDPDLVGRATMAGPVPHDLRPIRHGYEELEAGSSLKEQTLAALAESQFLIVVCSPDAAKSRHVNEEIRHFKALGRGTHVIAVIVDGVPGDAEHECFPPALREKIAPDGTATGEPVEPIGVDAREQGDGKQIALMRVVAALIAVPFDELQERAAIARKRRFGRMVAGAIVAATVAVVAGSLVWQHYAPPMAQSRYDTAAARQPDNIALVQKLLAESRAQPLPAREASVAAAVADIATGAAKGAAGGDARFARALDLLRANKVDDAIALLADFAADNTVQQDAGAAAAAWRDVGAIAGLRDPAKARDAYARAVAREPDDWEGLLWSGALELDAGNLEAAERFYQHVLAVKRDEPDGRTVYWAGLGLGAVAESRGRLDAALAAYLAARSSADRAAKGDLSDPRRQFDLAAAHEHVGDIQRAQGDLPAALKSFRTRHDIVSALARAEPGNVAWQRDLSVSYNRIGEVVADQGDPAEALKFFADARAIAGRLAAADPDNVIAKRDQSVCYEHIGNALVAQGHLPEALKAFRDGLAITQLLTEIDPGNAVWRRDLSVAQEHIGDVLKAQGDLAAALQSLRDSLAIRTRLAQEEPSNAGRQRDLSVSYDGVGDTLAAQGDLPTALQSFRDGLDIREHLTNADPGNPLWQHDLSVSDDRVGDLLAAQHRLQEALKLYRDALAVRLVLAKADPASAGAQFDLVVSNWKLAQNGDDAAARFAFIVTMLRKLKEDGKLTPAWERWLPLAEEELAKLAPK
jgi:tetratricopeptide (TPR) repeat protein